MNKKEIVKKLLIASKKQYEISNLIDDVHQMFSSIETTPEYEGVILDIVGIPKDNTVKKGTNINDSDYFCRDGWSEIIYHYQNGEITLDDCVKDLFDESWKKEQ